MPAGEDELGFSAFSNWQHHDTKLLSSLNGLPLTHAIVHFNLLHTVPIARAGLAPKPETRQPPRAAFAVLSVLMGMKNIPRAGPFTWLRRPP